MTTIYPARIPRNDPIIQEFLKPDEDSCLLFCSDELTINNNVFFRSRKIDEQKLFNDFRQQVDQLLIDCYDLTGVPRLVRGSEEHSALQQKVSRAINQMMDTRSGVSDEEITRAIETGIFPDRMVKALAKKISEEYDIPKRDHCLPPKESNSENKYNRGPDGEKLYKIGEKHWLCKPPRFITPMNVCEVSASELISLRDGIAVTGPVEPGHEPTDEQKSYWVKQNFCRVAPELASYCGSKKPVTRDVPDSRRVESDLDSRTSRDVRKIDDGGDSPKNPYEKIYSIARKLSDADLGRVYSGNKFIHDKIVSFVNENLEKVGSSTRVSAGDRDVLRGVYMLTKTADMNGFKLLDDVTNMSYLVTRIVLNRK